MEVYPSALCMADDSGPISPSASDASAIAAESSPISLYLCQSQLPCRHHKRYGRLTRKNARTARNSHDRQRFSVYARQFPNDVESVTMRRSCTTLLTIPLTCLMVLAAAHAQSADKPDLSKQPTLYVVGCAHLDTEWRWEYPQVIDEYIRKTMEDNFKLFDKYPHYVFNFSGAAMTLVPPAGS